MQIKEWEVLSAIAGATAISFVFLGSGLVGDSPGFHLMGASVSPSFLVAAFAARPFRNAPHGFLELRLLATIVFGVILAGICGYISAVVSLGMSWVVLLAGLSIYCFILVHILSKDHSPIFVRIFLGSATALSTLVLAFPIMLSVNCARSGSLCALGQGAG